MMSKMTMPIVFSVLKMENFCPSPDGSEESCGWVAKGGGTGRELPDVAPSAGGAERLILSASGRDGIGATLDTGVIEEERAKRINSLAAVVASYPQAGQLTGAGSCMFTGSTSNLNFVPQPQSILTSISLLNCASKTKRLGQDWHQINHPKLAPCWSDIPHYYFLNHRTDKSEANNND